MTNNANLGAIAVSPAATTQAGNGLFNNPGVFKQYAEPAKANTAVAVAASAVTTPVSATGMATLLATGDALFAQFANLKATVLDRSDRALWSYLGDVYDWVRTINDSVQKRETKAALIKKIKERDGSIVSSAATTEAVVIRFLFPDAARQTRNNYVIVFEKALALDKEKGQFFAFIESHGGIAHVVDKNFEENGDEQDQKDASKAEREEQVTLVRRLLNAKPHCGYSSELTSAEVEDYNLSFKQVAELKDSQKSKPKNQRGDYVFFVAVPGAGVDEYTVVHGFKAARDFEERMFLEIAKGKQKDGIDLKTEVENFETAACEALSEQ